MLKWIYDRPMNANEAIKHKDNVLNICEETNELVEFKYQIKEEITDGYGGIDKLENVNGGIKEELVDYSKDVLNKHEEIKDVAREGCVEGYVKVEENTDVAMNTRQL